MNQGEYLAAQKRHYDHCLKVSEAKSSDYASGDDPFRNFRTSAAMINRPVWEVMISRMTEKLLRVSNILEKRSRGEREAVTDEPVEKTMEDLVVYPNLLWTWLEEEEKVRSKVAADPIPVVTHMGDCQCMVCILERSATKGE